MIIYFVDGTKLEIEQKVIEYEDKYLFIKTETEEFMVNHDKIIYMRQKKKKVNT